MEQSQESKCSLSDPVLQEEQEDRQQLVEDEDPENKNTHAEEESVDEEKETETQSQFEQNQVGILDENEEGSNISPQQIQNEINQSQFEEEKKAQDSSDEKQVPIEQESSSLPFITLSDPQTGRTDIILFNRCFESPTQQRRINVIWNMCSSTDSEFQVSPNQRAKFSLYLQTLSTNPNDSYYFNLLFLIAHGKILHGFVNNILLIDDKEAFEKNISCFGHDYQPYFLHLIYFGEKVYSAKSLLKALRQIDNPEFYQSLTSFLLHYKDSLISEIIRFQVKRCSNYIRIEKIRDLITLVCTNSQIEMSDVYREIYKNLFGYKRLFDSYSQVQSE